MASSDLDRYYSMKLIAVDFTAPNGRVALGCGVRASLVAFVVHMFGQTAWASGFNSMRQHTRIIDLGNACM